MKRKKNRIHAAIEVIDGEIQKLQHARQILQDLSQRDSAEGAVHRDLNPEARQRRDLSPEARQRIAKAQRVRWAKYHAARNRKEQAAAAS